MIAWPAQAAVGRPVPKSKIYSRSKRNTRLKDLFVRQVEQIVWQYKLAPETINLPAQPGVPEIQIFGLQLKSAALHYDVLRAIDGAVQYPVLFELTWNHRVRAVACYKRPGETDTGRWVTGDYYSGPWEQVDRPRTPMPVALQLGGLYEQLLQSLMPLAVRPGETLARLVERIALVKAKEREVERATARLNKEIQFNRKVEINANLRKLKAELEELS